MTRNEVLRNLFFTSKQTRRRRNYTFCFGQHIKKCAVIFIIYYFVTTGIWYIGRYFQPFDQNILYDEGASTISKIIAFFLPPFGYNHVIPDFLTLFCGVTFLLAIATEKQRLVWSMRIYQSIVVIACFLAAISLSILALFDIFGYGFWKAGKGERLRNPTEHFLSTCGPLVFLFLAVCCSNTVIICFFFFKLATRFREYLQDMEYGIIEQAEIRMVNQ